MIRPQKRNYNLRNHGKFFAITFLGIILLTTFYFWGNKLSPSFVKLSQASSFVIKIGNSIKSGFAFLEPKSSLITENQSLKKRIGELQEKVFDYDVILSENIALYDSLNLKRENFIPANILIASPRIPGDRLIINRGEKDGVFIGAKAFLSERVVIGVVEEVYKTSSQIKMYSSAGTKTDAILERSGSIVTLEGGGSGNFILEVPLDFEISSGDLFFLPGALKAVVAQVGSVKKEITSSFAKVLLTTPLQVRGDSILRVESNL